MEQIHTDAAPASIGPFSQALRDNDRIFVSEQGPVDPDSGDVVSDDIGEQTAQTLDNIAAVLKAAGSSWNCSSPTTRTSGARSRCPARRLRALPPHGQQH
ncbi:Rid family hydrolase [Halegenticoccus tardaugens]|uniref:Rid family hydrolase n=1 Tax=Halegenticoccus tardaugens TaxID=2071624 RepID=UPI00100B679C|nr:Rid family hydrolase [Halegenticoccus tardaugens]